MTDTTTTTRREVAIDTEIAAAYVAWVSASNVLMQESDYAISASGAKPLYDYRGKRTGRWSLTMAEALDALRALTHSDSYGKAEQATKRLAAYDAALTAARATHDEYVAQNARYEGWSRFFLVTNTNGHIHRSMECSTCFPTTSYAWLTSLSGLTEKDAVDEQGTRLCSVCFPSAPVEWTQGYYEAQTKARKAEKAAERAAKAAAKAAKAAERALTHHYGTRFYRESDGAVIDHFDYPTTLKAATRNIADWGNYNGRYVVVDLDTMTEVA